MYICVPPLISEEKLFSKLQVLIKQAQHVHVYGSCLHSVHICTCIITDDWW